MVCDKILVVHREVWTLFAILMFIILFHYILIRLCVTDLKTSTIVGLHFILIKWNFYDHYFTDVCTFLKKIHVSGLWDSKL
jgi:hypothetical protein